MPAEQRDILLVTANARYSHSAFALRWLQANLGPLREHSAVREFTIHDNAADIAEALLAEGPRIIGFSVYIWNAALLAEVAAILKAVRPELTIVIGGPEVQYEYAGNAVFEAADYLVRGEGEAAFAELCARILAGDPPADKVIDAVPPDIAQLALPYDLYTDGDIAHRVLYVESSRGCPFTCEFCLSSLDERVRETPLEPFLAAMERLLARGARRFKFIDRTFNLKRSRVEAILRFFLARWRDGMQLHFEIVPDRLHPAIRELLGQFPPGGLHLEAGVQTFNPDVLARISRRQNREKTLANLAWLRTHGAILHADLIAGLPGESLDSFARSIDALLSADPQEIQVGILKRLKGTPIIRHEQAFGMRFSKQPPYEILQNNDLPFECMQRLKRFARYFDLYYNSGNFQQSLPLLWQGQASAFHAFLAFSDALWELEGRVHKLPLAGLAQRLAEHLVQAQGCDPALVARCIEEDFRRLPGRRDKLPFLDNLAARAETA